jgi:hypothetical protein
MKAEEDTRVPTHNSSALKIFFSQRNRNTTTRNNKIRTPKPRTVKTSMIRESRSLFRRTLPPSSSHDRTLFSNNALHHEKRSDQAFVVKEIASSLRL